MENLGPYKLEAVLGRGGMGTVYRAIHSDTQAVHALKVLAPAYSADDHFRNRFESEIKALLKLNHPNIVRLISYGQDDQNLYFAMELVDGQSLFQLQRDGKPFHWREVIRIAKNVALGLRHAHDRGIIHRDLKPGNLLKANTGIIKITDFGIAKSFGQTQNTGTNVVGTVDFMSPEQAKGQPVTFRSDLYSLGTVMFTLLAGRPPFTANSVEESMRNLTKVPAPRISRQSPDVPQALDQLIAQLLEKDPDKRIQTALSMYHHLKHVEDELRGASQAKTAERPSGSAEKTKVNIGPTTSVDQQRLSRHTIENNPDPEIENDSHYRLTGEEPGDVSADNRTATVRTQAPEQREDFYRTITDDDRHPENAENNFDAGYSSVVGKYVLGGLLLIVLGLAGFGLFQVNQVPSAESLFAQIEDSKNNPQKRISEIKQFLKHYPKHKNASLVEQRRALATAFQKAHKLRAQSKGPAKLSLVESRFLEIVDDSSSDRRKSLDRLQALITLFEADESLSSRDLECIDAARAYLVPFTERAEQQEQKVRDNIENQIKRARKLPRNDAIVVYQSIIELNQQYSWVADLLDEARKQINLLQQQ